MAIHVLLVDDHRGVRAFIRNLLAKAADIEVVGEAQDGPQALQLAEQLRPDVMLLDIEMPGMTGIEVTHTLQQKASPIRILAVSSYNERHLIVRMLNSGACGYLVKDEAPGHLLTAIRAVAQGKCGWVVETRRREIEPYLSLRSQ